MRPSAARSGQETRQQNTTSPPEKLPELELQQELQHDLQHDQQHDQKAAPRRRAAADVARQWYRRIVLDLILRRTVLPPSQDGRHIPLRLAEETARPPQLADERRGLGASYLSNAIRTSRYTVIDFVPKQLLFQFSRLGNFYFLCVGIPQTIPGISTTGNVTTILPLLFFVLLTVVKEGYDDYKRHRLDKVENSSLATVLRRDKDSDMVGMTWSERAESWVDIQWARFVQWKDSKAKGKGKAKAKAKAKNMADREKEELEEPAVEGFRWKKVQWRNIHVGDVVRLKRDEEVPADMILLHADGEGGLAYVETMALDGETNLKSKQVPAPLVHGRCADISRLVQCPAHFVVEDPNLDLYRFDGRITVDDETLPLSLAEVIYRGSTIRNTPTTIGLVINTGEECKSRMNANRHPSAKKPALERVTNSIVLILAAYVILLSAGCSIGYYIWHERRENHSWYLDNASVEAHEIILGFIIQFNNVIPLALYVSLEIVKLGQMLLLNSDLEMYDKRSDTPARCNTNTILENLGQIGYVFSDKTGTLTENVMKFRKMSVAGTSWLHEADIKKEDGVIQEEEEGEDGKDGKDGKERQVTPGDTRPSISAVPSIVEPPSSTVQPRPSASNDNNYPRPSVDSLATDRFRRSSSQWRSTGRPDHVQPELTTEDLIEYVRLRPNTPFAKKAVAYILAMALCHTCLPELEHGKVVDFQSASPDELALVRAAEELGFLVVQKSAQSTTLRFTYNSESSDHPIEEVYEVVDVIEFSSQRKRMSIIVRRPDGKLWLICKGADSVIMPRLKMAPLAMQKARDVRKSADMEREMLRKSEQHEPRSSFGGPASVTIRKSIGGSHRERTSVDKPFDKSFDKSFDTFDKGHVAVSNPMLQASRFETLRSHSLDVQRPSPFRRSMDAMRGRPNPLRRAPSFDVFPKSQTGSKTLKHPVDVVRRSMTSTRAAGRYVPDKFAFLESANFTPEDESAVFEQCFRHIDEFAAEGLRTLMFAHKFLSETEYRSWKADFLAASTSLTDRQDRIEAVAEAIEQNLDLIGASAIEDKLQRGVPETIDKLRRANIKIWMLTGDKRETAINIAHSARICRPASDIYILDSTKGDLAGQLLHIAESLGLPEAVLLGHDPAPPSHRPSRLSRFRLPKMPFSMNPHTWMPPVRTQRSHTVVVIDGQTLGLIEDHHHQSSVLSPTDPDLRALFYSIIPTVDAVLCCRASPSQKALLVRSIRHGNSRQHLHPGLTLAIGDGANDLAMLAEAHVGVGVSGREGLQAARVADYSIAQFRFLSRMLLVHGRWNYVRTAQFILGTFWKEMFFYTPAAAYQWYVGYTGTSIYESWSLTVLNTLFTSLCTIVPGISEQDLSAAVLTAVPELYVYGQRGLGLHPAKYVGWMLLAVSEGVVVWFGCWAGFGAFIDFHDPGLFPLGDMVFTVCVIWTNCKLFLLHTHYKSRVLIFAFLLTVTGWWAWNGFLSGAYAASPSPYNVRHGFSEGYGRDLKWWTTVFVLVMALAVAETGYRAIRRNLAIDWLWKGGPGPFLRVWRWPWILLRLVRRVWARLRNRGRGAQNNTEVVIELGFDDDDDDDLDGECGISSHTAATSTELPADELDVELWQEMERDPGVQERLRLINEAEKVQDEDDGEDDEDDEEESSQWYNKWRAWIK